MRILLLLLLLACGWTLRDLGGRQHDTSNNMTIIVFGSVNCAPVDRLVKETLSPLAQDYKLTPLIVFPCIVPNPLGIQNWQARVPGATDMRLFEVSIFDPICDMWFDVGARVPHTFLLNEQGQYVTNWFSHKWREHIAPPLLKTMKKVDLGLKIRLEHNKPVASWKTNSDPWKLICVTNRNQVTFTLKAYE